MSKNNKSPTLQTLIQQQLSHKKQLLTLLPSPLPTPPYPQLPLTNLSQNKKNPWQEINTLITKTQKSINQYKSFKSQKNIYVNVSKQYQINKLRNQICKNKLKINRLYIEKMRFEENCRREQIRLDMLLEEYDQIQKKANKSGITVKDGDQIQIQGYMEEVYDKRGDLVYLNQNNQELQYPNIQELLNSIPENQKASYLQSLRNSHPTCKPLQLYNFLSNQTIKTNHKILYLTNKKYQQQQKIQQLLQICKQNESQHINIYQQLSSLQTKQKYQSKQLQNIQKQLSYITNPNYIQNQIKQRIELQKKIYLNQCKNKYKTIMKLVKLVQLSENRECYQEVQAIMKNYCIEMI